MRSPSINQRNESEGSTGKLSALTARILDEPIQEINDPANKDDFNFSVL